MHTHDTDADADADATPGHEAPNAPPSGGRRSRGGIRWQAFSQKVFERAKRENRLVMLMVDAKWCHWCRKMDAETFSHPDVIAAIEADYIPVRIDRDQRPDLDRRLQEAVQLLRIGGGWPLCVIFSPAGDLAFGTTFLPAEDDHVIRRRGMAPLLGELAHRVRSEGPKVAEMSAQMVQLLAASQSPDIAHGPAGTALAALVLGQAARLADPQHGGIRTEGAKFPHATLLELGLAWSEMPASEGEDLRPDVREFVSRTLTEIGLSGLYDHLGDGFHRYANDPFWAVPEFEKLATDNAALLRAYTLGARVLGDPFFANVARGIVRFVLETLLDPAGGFFHGVAADPADDGDQSREFGGGRYYTWLLREVEDNLPEELADAFSLYFGIHKRGDMPGSRSRENVLRVSASVADVAAELQISPDDAEQRIQRAAHAMLKLRKDRPAPAVDRRLFTDTVAEVAHALLMFSRLLPDEPLAKPAAEQAIRALDRMLAVAHHPGIGLSHEWPDSPTGASASRHQDVKLLADHAWAALALLDAFALTGRRAHLDAAQDAIGFANRFLWHEDGGYRDTLPTHPPPTSNGDDNDDGDDGDAAAEGADPLPGIVTLHRRPVTDSPTASGNGSMLRALVRAGIVTNDETKYIDRAKIVADALAGTAAKAGFLAATFALGAAELDERPATVVIAGKADDPRTAELLDAARRTAPPSAVVFALDPATETTLAAAHGAELVDGAPAMFVCVANRCLPPQTDPHALRDAHFRPQTT